MCVINVESDKAGNAVIIIINSGDRNGKVCDNIIANIII